MRKLLFNYSFYSHPEIWKFQGVTEDQPQPQTERKIELCTSDTVDLAIINLQDAARLFKIRVSTIRMVQHLPFTDDCGSFGVFQ
jgi:hypothetical protein